MNTTPQPDPDECVITRNGHAHGPHHWDVEDRDRLRRECPGLPVASTTPETPNSEPGRTRVLLHMAATEGRHDGTFAWFCRCGAGGNGYTDTRAARRAGDAHLDDAQQPDGTGDDQVRGLACQDCAWFDLGHRRRSAQRHEASHSIVLLPRENADAPGRDGGS
jgi:hypothetical protein